MELIYLYIEKFGDYIYKQGIKLSNNFDVEIRDKKLTIVKKQNLLSNFYGSKIKNISVLVGKNGTGKTTILDILGMTRRNRIDVSITKNKVKDEYFLLYHLDTDSDGKDLFGVEVFGEKVLYNMIENCNTQLDDEWYDKSKTSIGKIYKYENDTLVSLGKHFFDYSTDEYQLSELIRYAHIGEEHRYSKRNKYFEKSDSSNAGYIAERNFLSKPTVYKKYLTLIKCINKEIQGFECDKFKMKFEDDIEYQYWMGKEDHEEYKNILESIEEKLYAIKNTHLQQIPLRECKLFRAKEDYIYDLYLRYIMDMIVSGIFSSCRYGEKTAFITENKAILLDIDYIIKLGTNTSSEEKFGEPNNYRHELDCIMNLITVLESKFKNADEIFKTVARYVGSRMHSKYENHEFGYVDALEGLINELKNISEKYFKESSVEFIIKGERDKYIEKFLERYSYFELRKQNSSHSDIGNKFIISFDLLSEGEERFVDIITKINDCISENADAKLLILLLDEPDQSLHPEWARQFIYIITNVIESLAYTRNIQILLSTHSPYLLTDILPTEVSLLERNSENRLLKIHTIDKTRDISCFGANIYNLMKNEFFMTNTLGEFATKKINEYWGKMNKVNITSEEIREIDYFIEQIGEPIIQKAMRKNLEEKK